jgi:hypothetical protein
MEPPAPAEPACPAVPPKPLPPVPGEPLPELEQPKHAKTIPKTTHRMGDSVADVREKTTPPPQKQR